MSDDPNRKMPVKAISLFNPWAHLVVHGKKIIETRSWGTEYQGWLLIHAGLNYGEKEREFSHDPYVQEALEGEVDFVCGEPIMPRGGYIGMVRLVCSRWHQGSIERAVNASRMHHHFRLVAEGETGKKFTGPVRLALTAEEEAFGDYAAGRWAWYLTNPIAFPQLIPAKGRQKLFNPTPEEIERICAAVPAVAQRLKPAPLPTESEMRRDELRSYEERLRRERHLAPMPRLLESAKS